MLRPAVVFSDHMVLQREKEIRYAWENFPVVSLFGQNGLPCFPFDLPVIEN